MTALSRAAPICYCGTRHPVLACATDRVGCPKRPALIVPGGKSRGVYGLRGLASRRRAHDGLRRRHGGTTGHLVARASTVLSKRIHLRLLSEQQCSALYRSGNCPAVQTFDISASAFLIRYFVKSRRLRPSGAPSRRWCAKRSRNTSSACAGRVVVIRGRRREPPQAASRPLTAESTVPATDLAGTVCSRTGGSNGRS